MWKNRSIAFRLNMTLCPLIIFGVLFAIFINSEISYRTLEREIRERSMPALTNSIQSEIAIELSVAQRSLQYLSRWRTLTNWIKNGERQEELENIKDVCRTFVDVFKTGNINLTVDVTRNFYEAINNYPPTFKILDPVIDKWFDDIKDSNVKVRAHLHPVSDPVYGGQAFVNARVEDENGHFLGIVSTPFNLAGVQLLLKTKKIGQNGLTFIMHSDGLILLHPDPALVHKHITDLPGFEHLAWQDLSQKESSTRTTDHNGKALLIGSQPLDTMDGVIVTVADEAELFMDIDLARRYSLYAGLTVLLVTLGVSLRVSLIISRSFGSIINFANQVAAGLNVKPFEHQDSKEMRALAEALNDMHAQLRTSNLSLNAVHRIFDELDVALMVCNPDTDEVIFTNARLNKDFNISENTLRKKCWQIFYNDKSQRCDGCPLDSLKYNKTDIVRQEVYNPVSNKRYIEISTLIDWTDNTKVHLLQRLDVTEQKALEKELISAMEAASQSSRAKSEFLSRMSHEMRTPLNAVMGMANIALTTSNQEKQRSCLNKINEAAAHLLDIINEVLDMSQVEAKSFKLVEEEHSLTALIRRVMDNLRIRAKAKQQEVSLVLAPDLPDFVMVDGQRFSQVLSHLVANAIKFTPEKGRISLVARLLKEKNQRCDIEISVTDTGIGIPEDKLGELFTAFEQIDGGVARKFGGTGLGLALSKKIVEAMHGDITVALNETGGCTFTVNVPLKRGQKDNDKKAPDALTVAGGDNAAATDSIEGIFAGYRVLLAEDVNINREIVMALLEPTGIAIDCAANGKEAVDMYLSNPDRYHLIFMDLNMPEVDGYEAVKQIRASGLQQAALVPIIAMTANTFREDVEQCLAVGMNDHLAKPVMLDTLMEKMRAYLPKKQH